MDAAIRRYATLASAPGECFQSSNLGYGLLASVMQRVSGDTDAGFLRAKSLGRWACVTRRSICHLTWWNPPPRSAGTRL